MTSHRVMVSGATGFIGRWGVRALVTAGHEVHALAGPSMARTPPSQLSGAVVHPVDLLDAAAVQRLMAAVKPTHLLHFAWIATPGVYSTSPQNARWLAASQELLRCFHANGGRRAVMAGSCAEYDWSRVGVCHELLSPLVDAASPSVTPYARAKTAMQVAMAQYSRAHSLSSAWGRVFFLFGPEEPVSRLVAAVISSLLAGREAACTHGRQVRSFLHVADVGAAFAALLDSTVQGPVNIGSAERISIAEVCGEIGSQIGRPDLVRLGARAAPADEPPILVPDVERLRTLVGWQPRVSLREGIAQTIDWWRGRSLI